ncbi:MAG: 4a-hydroxytetrahydrobiopterin dehydratase [Ignavibacteriales bacterium]|nr:4a-hydroxytetrahydrobiopterin dehydratase [Ignavibacteriales bacterium]
MKLINIEEINKKLQDLPGWSLVDNSIQKEFTLKDFVDALGFLMKIGFLAERHDHHPDLLLHSWNKVKIIISTHSEGGLTEKDFNLAEQIEKIN